VGDKTCLLLTLELLVGFNRILLEEPKQSYFALLCISSGTNESFQDNINLELLKYEHPHCVIKT
jgi:hypothetical protein